jgi:hypothetical protein
MSKRQHVYEVGVFNERVRKALAEGAHHAVLSDDWADIHYFEVVAVDEREARAKITRRYSAANGYVITEAKMVRED